MSTYRPDELRRQAEARRQEAASLVRFIRQSNWSGGAAWRRHRAEELYREADQLEARAERGAS